MVSSILFSMILGYGSVTMMVLLPEILSGTLTLTDLGLGLDTLFFGGFTLSAFIIYPLVLTTVNLVLLFCRADLPELRKRAKGFEIVTLILGILYSALIQLLLEIHWTSDWQETLANRAVHAPIYTQAWPTVLTLALVGFAGYTILSFVKLEKLPPLVTVCAMAAMYLGTAEAILFTMQVFSLEYLVLCLFPVNCVLIAAKTVRYKIVEWNRLSEAQNKTWENPLFNTINRKLKNAAYWPLVAFFLMWPLLGILIVVLVLFGQKPDTVIKAWTETSDWNLSQQVSPQNVYYDEHYLCTVAAGGHRKLVKPLRMGERHGHQVVVNRQLCVANAFEQLLEERTPNFHRHVRHFYDTYGFPVARMIRSRYIADAIYLAMKPLEWFFLLVLYLCDVNPENRIAVQYLPKRKEHIDRNE